MKFKRESSLREWDQLVRGEKKVKISGHPGATPMETPTSPPSLPGMIDGEDARRFHGIAHRKSQNRFKKKTAEKLPRPLDLKGSR